MFFRDYQLDTDLAPEDFGEKDDCGRTRTVIARTEWGQMMDFLKAYPSVSKEEYLWSYTVPQVKLAALDNTHIEYLTEEQARKWRMRCKARMYDDPMSLVNDLGVPVFRKQ